jgi:phosphatidylinositol alpha-1,6-mannosyltransferase
VLCTSALAARNATDLPVATDNSSLKRWLAAQGAASVRILILSEAFRSLGGVQEVIDNLAAELESMGHEAAVFSTAPIDGKQRTTRFGGEYREIEIPSRRPVTLRHLERLWQPGLSAGVKRLAAEISAWQPQIASSHCWAWDRFPAVVMACRDAGVPLVHSLYDSWGAGKMGTDALRCLEGAAALTALSNATRDFFAQLLPAARGARVISGGVDPDGARNAAPRLHSRPYIFCAARLDLRHKALDALIEAFTMLAAEYPDLDLLIGGDGPDRSLLESMASAAGLRDRVKFVGMAPRPQLWSLYQHALLFAMPSRMPEGLGLVFLEAMACATPVVATRSGGTPEIVDHDRTGLLVDNNTPAELASAIRRLLNDPEKRRRMGERARKAVAARYSWREFAHQYLEVYSSCPGVNAVEPRSEIRR